MRIAILSDAHGNKVFYDKVMNALEKECPDKIIYLGDMFGYMMSGMQIYNDLVKRNAVILKGNHEAMLVGELPIDSTKEKIYHLIEQKKQLDNLVLEKIKQLPSEFIIKIDGCSLLYIHGAPFDIVNGYLYEDDSSYEWNDCNYDYIFMGHTHRMYIKKRNKTTYVNVGSCGLPRDIGLQPTFCIFETVTREVLLRRLHVGVSVLESEQFMNIAPEVSNIFLRGA